MIFLFDRYCSHYYNCISIAFWHESDVCHNGSTVTILTYKIHRGEERKPEWEVNTGGEKKRKLKV